LLHIISGCILKFFVAIFNLIEIQKGIVFCISILAKKKTFYCHQTKQSLLSYYYVHKGEQMSRYETL